MQLDEFLTLTAEGRKRMKENGYVSVISLKNYPDPNAESQDGQLTLYTVMVGSEEAIEDLRLIEKGMTPSILIAWMSKHRCKAKIIFTSGEAIALRYRKQLDDLFDSAGLLLTDGTEELPFLAAVDPVYDPYMDWEYQHEPLSELAEQRLGIHLDDSIEKLKQVMSSFKPQN